MAALHLLDHPQAAAQWLRAVRALPGLSDNRAVYGKTSLEAIESALRHSTRTLAK